MRRHWFRRPSPFLATCMLLVLSACGGQVAPSTSVEESADGGEQPASTDETTATGGTLSIAFEGDIASLDPSQGYDFISWPAERLIFETLVGYSGSTDIVPVLATEMPEVSEDGTVYTFTLREGVSFVKPDGSIHREMTADDVVYSLNRLLNPNLTPTPSPVGGSFFALIDGAQAVLDGDAEEASGLVAVDDHTVEITITNADQTFLNIMALPFASVVPADLAGEDTEAFASEPGCDHPTSRSGRHTCTRPAPVHWPIRPSGCASVGRRNGRSRSCGVGSSGWSRRPATRGCPTRRCTCPRLARGSATSTPSC